MGDPLSNGSENVLEGDFAQRAAKQNARLEAEKERITISEQARLDAENEPEEEGQLAIPTLEGDKPFALAGLGPRGMAVESEVSVMSAAVPVSGLLDPDKRGQLLVSFAPASYTYVPVRENGKVVRYKLRQQVRPDHVITASTLAAVAAVVMNVAQGGTSPADIRATVEETLKEIASAVA